MPDINEIEITEQSIKEKLEQRLINLRTLSLLKNEKDGLLLKPEAPTVEQIQTNKIFNKLGDKILDACGKCLESQVDQEKYLETANVLLVLFESISRIGDGTMSFSHQTDKELYSGNKVSYFQSDPFFTNNTEISMQIYVRPVDEKINLKGKILTKAQARTNIEITSPSIPSGRASIRIDPPDSRLDNNIVFDISVGRADQQHSTIIDQLNLDQKAGHHFPSGVRIEDLQGVEIPDIHRTVSARLDELTK